MPSISGKTLLLNKVILEVRYNEGYRYLDRCGSVLNLLARSAPEWRIVGANPQGTPLVSLRNGCTLEFSAERYALDLEQTSHGPLKPADLDTFFEQVGLCSELLHQELGLSKFERIGCRIWLLAPCESQEEAENWLLQLGAYRVSDSFRREFGRELSAVSFAAVIVGDDRLYRVALNGVERHARFDAGTRVFSVRASQAPAKQKEIIRAQAKQKARLLMNPSFAAMIDVDAYQEQPEKLDPAHFVRSSIRNVLEKLPKALDSKK